MDHPGKRIKQIRIDKKLTQTDLADAIGSTKASISRLENGKRTFEFEKVLTLADYLGVSVFELYGIQNAENQATDAQPTDKARPAGNDINDRRVRELTDMFVSYPKDTQRRILDVVKSFGRLNGAGQKQAAARVRELTELRKYKID